DEPGRLLAGSVGGVARVGGGVGPAALLRRRHIGPGRAGVFLRGLLLQPADLRVELGPLRVVDAPLVALLAQLLLGVADLRLALLEILVALGLLGAPALELRLAAALGLHDLLIGLAAPILLCAHPAHLLGNRRCVELGLA